MALYRNKFILEGLDAIPPTMEHNLDIAYEICMSYRGDFPCEMCGRCCHQPNIIVRPEEIPRVASAAGMTELEFSRKRLVKTSDGRMLMRKPTKGACPFLMKDNRCSIWLDRPQICDDFPYAVSKFMSRVYLALTNPGSDILELIDYMDDTWPCTRVIKSTIREKVEARRQDVILS